MPQVGQPDIPYPMHQTWSSRLGMGPTYHANERSHMRFVMDTVGRPLSRFKTTKELVMALRDAIVGHQLAMERAGVLHRDVSSGNILIVDRVPVARPISHGVLLDYDYSSMTLEPPNRSMAVDVIPPRFPLFPLESLGQNDPENVADLKERTGTYYFIALDLLRSSLVPVMHDSCHDLESFYWVLVWIVLRHTAHNYPGATRQEACSHVFKFGNDNEASTAKAGWFYNRVPLIIDRNPPLTDLMVQLQEIVYESTRPRRGVGEPLTYSVFLDIFDAAIERQDWPTNDPALPFIPPRTSIPTVVEERLPNRQLQLDFEFQHVYASGLSGAASQIESSPSSRAEARRRLMAATPLASGSGAPENGGTRQLQIQFYSGPPERASIGSSASSGEAAADRGCYSSGKRKRDARERRHCVDIPHDRSCAG
ncbi:hypothetical protein TRAPUB_3316 [Trametes pubescens]|uniref:Fungal-type protein kinase domain-containing protein n=1 Tax=Trametes pubescens TaxID=154538 RepID=A0A1M2VDT1_TRAPU|nr:hypothetical protein TRAPUB_3316 [Trametes pubescens]